MSDLERLYTLAEACEALQITEADVSRPERWLRDQVRRLKLPFYKVGRSVKLPESTLDAVRKDMRRADTRQLSSASFEMPTASGRDPSTEKALKMLAELEQAAKARRKKR